MKTCDVIGKLPLPLGDMPGIAHDGGLLVLGGGSGREVTDAIFRIDPETGGVETVGRMPAGCRGHAAVTVDGVAYVLGGFAGGTTDTLFRLDLHSLAFEPLSPMPRTAAWFAACHHAGRIFVIGGFEIPAGYWSEVAVYDPAEDRWTVRADGFTHPLFPKRILGSNAVVPVGGELLSFGGADSFDHQAVRANALGVCAAYNPDSGAWRDMGVSIPPREGLVAALHGGDVFAVGGMGALPHGAYEFIDRVDVAAGRVETFARMAVGRVAPACGVVGSRLVIAGGSTTSAFAMTDLIECVDLA